MAAEDVATVLWHCCVRFEQKSGIQERAHKNWTHDFYECATCRFFTGSRLRAEMRKAKLCEASRSGDRISYPVSEKLENFEEINT